MGQLAHVAAGLAGSAGCCRFGAQQLLRQPEGEPLFAHPARSLQEKTRWQSSGPDALTEPLAQVLVSVEFNDRHLEIWSLEGRRSGVRDPWTVAQFLTLIFHSNQTRTTT